VHTVDIALFDMKLHMEFIVINKVKINERQEEDKKWEKENK
jgi:hypothetical protein